MTRIRWAASRVSRCSLLGGEPRIRADCDARRPGVLPRSYVGGDGSMTDDNREASIVSQSSEFVRIAGLRFVEASGSRVRGFIELGEHPHTPWGVVHGGVYATAVERGASVGASEAVEENGQ